MAIVDSELVGNYQQIHSEKHFGYTAKVFWEHIQSCILELKPAVILEYGCGQSRLSELLVYGDAQYCKYDPAIPELANVPVDHADFIINTDVMEHIPESDIDDVLRHMRSLSPNVFFNIALGLANEILPNGENAHCTIWPSEKWLQRIQKFFPEAEIVKTEGKRRGCLIITWPSDGQRELLCQIEILKQLAYRKKDTVLKKVERRFRMVRNKLIGKERVHRIRATLLGGRKPKL